MKDFNPDDDLIKAYNLLRKKSASKSDKLDALEHYKDLIKYLEKNIDNISKEELYLIKNSSLVYEHMIRNMSLKGDYFKRLKEDIDTSYDNVSSSKIARRIFKKK